MSVLLQTSFGDLTIDLQTQKFPTATYNFLKLCKFKHYNNAIFLKVQKDFVTQISTKKPTTIWQAMGQNKPYFKDQIDMQAKVNSLGLVGTSNSGSNMNNSEFFITLTKAHLSSLNGKHTVFGKVEEGLDVLKKINQTYVDEKGRPQMNIRILHTFVLDDPFADPQNLKYPQSPKLQRDPLRLQAIQHLEMLQKYATQNDILQATKRQKAKKQAITLQMLGQLPDANVKPKQTSLFICKLNPVTQERDLQIIFSRFGPIKSVQIVRDWKTGQSLQYGFIEFQSQKSCEEAYLKMDGVLIDERRIKVDFSQSVSKLMPKMKNNQHVHHHHKGEQNKQKNRQIVKSGRTNKQSFGMQEYDIVAAKDKRRYTNTNLKIQKQKSLQSLSQKSQQRLRKRKKQKKQKQEKKKKKQKKDKKSQKQRYEVYKRKDRSVSKQSYSQSSDSNKNRKRSRSRDKKSKKTHKYD